MLAQKNKITQAIAPAAGVAGTTDINGATLDMSGFEGVLMKVTFGAITASAVTSIKAQQGAASDLSDTADLLGTGQTIADTDDEKVFYIDLYKPTSTSRESATCAWWSTEVRRTPSWHQPSTNSTAPATNPSLTDRTSAVRLISLLQKAPLRAALT